MDSTAQTGADLETQIRTRFQPFAQRMALVYLRDRPLDEVTHALDGHTGRYGRVVRATGRAHAYERMTPSAGLNAVIGVSRVPIYGMLQTMVGQGAVGGYVFYNDETSKALAGMVLRVADGTPSATCPIRLVGTPMFDWRALQRWHIDERLAAWRKCCGVSTLSCLAGSLRSDRRGTGHRRGPTRPHCQPGVPSRRRQKVERALRTSESRTTAILRMVPDLMFVMSRDGVYLDYHARDPHDLFVPPISSSGNGCRTSFRRDGSSIPGEVRGSAPFR